jgi:transcriptional regulator with XRE-family HTH domain
MQAENMAISSTGKMLGISQSYLSELLAGDKQFKSANDDLIRSIAKFLNIPNVLGFVLAGKLRHEDFFDFSCDYDKIISGALLAITDSSSGIEFAVDFKTLGNLPASVKLLLITLYEQANGIDLTRVRQLNV